PRMTPARLALIATVGPPDCATIQFFRFITELLKFDLNYHSRTIKVAIMVDWKIQTLSYPKSKGFAILKFNRKMNEKNENMYIVS
ncbi:MAG: hypothetical protein PUJ55_02605, partial [Clostridiales bacterium]|nr:hypothetical protein [Clostridiales bacterium]MDY4111267.1 hypothetical protein [Roseburia sp.]